MASAQTISELLIVLGVEVDEADKAAKKIQGVTDSADKAEKTGGSKLSKFAKGAGIAFAAVAAAAAAAAVAVAKAGKDIFSFVVDTTANLDKIAKQADQSGLGVEQYQRLAFVAERSGTNIENVSKASRRIGVLMQDVAQGGGKMFTDTLASIGLSLEDIQGKDTTAQLGIIGDALNTFTDDGEKAAIAAKLLGEEAGPSLVPMLNEGTEGIKKLAAEAGNVFTEEDVGKSVDFQDSLTNVNVIINRVKGDLATALIPVMKDVIEKFTDWLQENEQFIEQDLPEILGKVVEVLSELLPIVADTIVEFKNFFKEIKQLDERLTEDFGPAWEYVKGAVSAALFPIKAVADAIGAVIDRITEFVRSSETLMALARRLGIGAFEKTTTRGAPRPGETPAETEARLLREHQEKEREAQVDKMLRKDLKDAARRNKRYGDKFASETVKGAKGRRFTQLEKDALRGVGKSDAEIRQYEKANIRRGRVGVAPGSAGKAAAATEAAARPLTSFEQLLGTTLGPGFELKQLEAVKQVKIKEEDIKPEAVVNITNNTFDITQNITGTTDPVAIGNEAAKAVKREFNIRLSRAAQAAQTNVAR